MGLPHDTVTVAFQLSADDAKILLDHLNFAPAPRREQTEPIRTAIGALHRALSGCHIHDDDCTPDMHPPSVH